MAAAVEHIVVMGVSGSGKTVVVAALGALLGWAAADGDDFHPASNVAKMAAGEALADEDRLPWLNALADWTRERSESGESTVLGCSALKRSYRDVLRGGAPATRFVHLVAPHAVLSERMGRRRHFMPPDLLESQLRTLEPLADDEPGVIVDVSLPLRQTVGTIVAALRLTPL